MSNAIQINNKIEAALIQGDLSGLNDQERLVYFHKVCESVGLNPLTRPFEYLRLSGKLVLYARKDATDQLRKIHGVSITKLETQIMNDICVVTAIGRDKSGKEDSEVGAVDVKGLHGEKLANAMMKASTKAKRRLTLSICGLGMLDETEVESMQDAKPEPIGAGSNVVPMTQVEHKEPNVVVASIDAGEYVINFGKKYLGRKVKEISKADLEGYISALDKYAAEKGRNTTQEVEDLRDAALTYYGSRS